MVLHSSRTKLAAAGCAGLYAWLCACRPSVDATPPALTSPPAPAPPSSTEPSRPPPAAAAAAVSETQPRSEADDEFLVVTRSGDLVLRTAKATLRVLARSVSDALYDPKLELVWLEGDSLRVVDLRRPGADPILIARDWQGTSRLSISHPASSLSNNETCDVGDATSLTWDENPKLERIDEQDVELRLESKDWLRAELHRPARTVMDETAFNLRYEQPRVQLPADVAHCEDPDECGRTVAFGASGLQLVLAVTLSGDCWHPYCLFHEPRSGVWTSPVLGDRWQGSAGGQAGPCGDYAFDRTGRSFLLGDRLCEIGGGCQDLGGDALGWRNPGPSVGAPSDFSMAPDPDEDEPSE